MLVNIASWNVNSVRLRLELIRKFTNEFGIDILCLQECKCTNFDLPYEEIRSIGYDFIYYNGQKSYNGVAILSKIPLERIISYDLCERGDARHICCSTKEGIRIHNFYVPAGGDEPNASTNLKFDYKLKYLEEMRRIFLQHRSERTIILGDFNVAPYEIDVWSHKQLLNVVSHTTVETDKLKQLMTDCGFKDVIREYFPFGKLYSWWSYRAKDWDKSDRGRRLDHLWASNDILERFSSCSIEREVRSWVRPSDHAPIISSFEL